MFSGPAVLGTDLPARFEPLFFTVSRDARFASGDRRAQNDGRPSGPSYLMTCCGRRFMRRGLEFISFW